VLNGPIQVDPPSGSTRLQDGGMSSGSLITHQDHLPLCACRRGVQQGAIEEPIPSNRNDHSGPLRSLRLVDGDRIPKFKIIEHFREHWPAYPIVPLHPRERITGFVAIVVGE
jgi:hypothetical protein